jgi:nitroreductase
MVGDMDALLPPPASADPTASAQWASALIQHRRTILPKRLAQPGPDERQLQMIFEAAAAAPDHGEIVPWRFVLVPPQARARLAQVFANALLERDPAAAAAQVERAKEKAFRAPVLLLAVVRAGAPDGDIPTTERLVSLGCAMQNMLLMATALGFGSALTSGKALHSPGLRALFGLPADEQAICFVSFGTASRRQPGRVRPATNLYVSTLPAEP